MLVTIIGCCIAGSRSERHILNKIAATLFRQSDSNGIPLVLRGIVSLAIVMIHHDNHLHVGHQGLNLMSELTGKGSIIVNRNIGDDID